VYVAKILWVPLPETEKPVTRKVAACSPNNTETVGVPLLFGVTTSSIPSPLKSPKAIDAGLLPLGDVTAALNVPSPFPSNVAIVFVL
jgi:hypothetical protein